MAILAAVLGLALVLLLIASIASASTDRSTGWETAFLIGVPIWGAITVVLLEILSAASAIRGATLTAGWLLVDAGLLLGTFAALRRRGGMVIRLPGKPRLAAGEWAFAIVLAALLTGLLAVGLIAPPNNADSLLYHMARVVHWAQNESLQPYGTAYGHQLWNPPWAEMAILQARILWGNDGLSNLVQWGALVGALVGVASLGRHLGLDRNRRTLGVAFAASIPMAVLQATSTQNDLVTALWLTIVAAIILLGRRRRLRWIEVVSLGLATGLGLLTKGTFYVFCLPLLAWFAATRDWRGAPRRGLSELALIGGLALTLNVGHWGRNLAVADTPLGPRDWVGAHSSTSPALVGFVPGVIRALAPHVVTPWPSANGAIESGVRRLSAAIGVEVDEPVVAWAWNHEDLAGNPIHLAMVGLSIVALIGARRRLSRQVFELAACAATAAVLMVLFIPPSLTTVGVRLQLPLFVLWSPVFAAALGPWLSARVAQAASTGVVLLGLPWLLFNTTRPLIGMQASPAAWEIPCTDTFGCTRIGSVLTVSRNDVLFANLRESEQDYVGIVDALRTSACRAVGLRIDSSDPEYPYWHLLDAPQSGVRLESIYTTPDLAPLLDRAFEPCAIVCTICGDRTRLHGLDLSFESGEAKLFLGHDFTWDEDG